MIISFQKIKRKNERNGFNYEETKRKIKVWKKRYYSYRTCNYSLTIDNILNIIVLLILAGVTIATLTGNNGILSRAQDAKAKTEEATLEEKMKLLVAEKTIDEYTGESEEKTAQELQKELNAQGENVLVIQWNKYIIFDLNENKEYRVMSDGNVEYCGTNNIVNELESLSDFNSEYINTDSDGNNVIGIDIEGNQIDMNLWECTLLNNGTYGLNDEDTYNCIEYGGDLDNSVRNKGYEGSYTNNGEIIKAVPAYISRDNGKTYIAVTDMYCTFRSDESLKVAPEIPNTVTNMWNTFNGCSSLIEIPWILPTYITNMESAFFNCKILETSPDIPENVVNMKTTFYGCESLKIAPNIPNKVSTMYDTFYNCTSMTIAPTIIPDSVIDMKNTFYNCTLMRTGPTKISNKVTDISSTFENCTSMVTGPTSIPSTVINMQRTFKNCTSLSGSIEVNANITGKLIDGKIDYFNAFNDAGINGNGIMIQKSSNTSKNILINIANQSSGVSLEK